MGGGQRAGGKGKRFPRCLHKALLGQRALLIQLLFAFESVAIKFRRRVAETKKMEDACACVRVWVAFYVF